MKKYILGIILIPLFSIAGSDQGGGGAGICIANRCMTLAEAGFRLLPEPSTTEIGSDVIAELNNIEKLLPEFPTEYKSYDYITGGKAVSASEVVGSPGDIQFVTSVNEKTVKKFLDSYKQVVNSNNGANLSESLQIIGFTGSNTNGGRRITYIINDKYEQLSSARSKALLLVHEYSLRGKNKSFVQALAFDGAIIDYLKAKEANDWSKLDIWNFLNITLDQEMANKYMIGDLIHRMGNISLTVLFSSYSDFGARLEYSKILENRKYDSRFSQYFSPMSIHVNNFSRGNLIGEYINAMTPILPSEKRIMTDKPEKRVVFTKQNFTAYINSLEKNKEAIKLLRSCKNADDESVALYALMDPVGFYRPMAAGCETSFISAENSFEESISNILTPYLNGIELNIPEKLVCRYTYEVEIDQTTCRFEK